MKLRAKVVVSTVLIAILAVVLCALLAAGFSMAKLLNDMTDSCIAQYQKFYWDFRASSFEIREFTSPMLESYLRYEFRNIEGSREFVLQEGDFPIVNNIGVDPVELLDAPKLYTSQESATDMWYGTADYGDESFFIVTSDYSIGEHIYSISLVRDISELMEGVTALAWQCILAGLCVAAVAALLIFAVITHALKPIDLLKRGARELAGGNYKGRIHIERKDELSELADDFNTMADAVEEHVDALFETAKRQRMFISGLSHELKTPVTSVMISADTLYTRKISKEDQRLCARRIYEQCGWLERLSGKLMALVMLREPITKKEESVEELFSAVSAAVEESLLKKGIRLKTDCRVNTLHMDFDLMQSALVNLVDNARKASEEGSQIEMSAYGATLEVADHGTGIPKEELCRVTEPFYMIDKARSRKNGGSGLGLALVGEIVSAHGARLLIDSEIGMGTTVRIVFNGLE